MNMRIFEGQKGEAPSGGLRASGGEAEVINLRRLTATTDLSERLITNPSIAKPIDNVNNLVRRAPVSIRMVINHATVIKRFSPPGKYTLHTGFSIASWRLPRKGWLV